MHNIGPYNDFLINLGPLAQSVEQQTFNLWVVGSIPTGPTLVIKSFLISKLNYPK